MDRMRQGARGCAAAPTLVFPCFLAVGFTILILWATGCSPKQGEPPASAKETRPASAPGFPRLVDLGAGKCIPCQKMAPILEEIRSEYRGALDVEFIDVWKDPSAGKRYAIRLIPTQVFYDAAGREIARHEGFLAKEDILGTFARSGIVLKKSAFITQGVE